MPYDVFGMCNALYDLQAEVPDSVLAELGFEKGGMFLIDEARQREIVPKIYSMLVHTEAGGSGANTMLGLALLGDKAAYTSRVADDEHGRLYRESLIKKGVKANLGSGPGETGISLILITPDHQRTMLTFLGQSLSLGPKDVNLDDLRSSKYLYVTGYLWDTDNQKAAVTLAMREANLAGVKVALSLSDPFCVNRHKADFQRLVNDHVDVVFGNYHEAEALTETSDPREALRALAANCEVAVVTLDKEGSFIKRGEEEHKIPVYPVKAVDTTGAGDMYAAGLLHGLVRGLPLDVTGRIAAYTAAKVVSKLGPRLDAIDQDELNLAVGGSVG